MSDRLFMLKPDFMDQGKKWFCPGTALVEGMLGFYPGLREKIDISYIDFARPRKPVLGLLGEANQGCPVLVLSADSSPPDGIECSEANGHRFINDEKQICAYLAAKFGTGGPH